MRTHVEGGRRRVVIYCRISDDREGERSGVERQERECRKRAERHGWDVVAVYVEDDTSAYSGKPRPLYKQMLDDLRSGRADAVLALAPTRLYRKIKDAFDFLDLIEERGIVVETVKAGRYDLSTADGRRDARRAAIDNQHESEQIGERVRDAKADNLARGEYRGGPRPFGYESDGITVRADEAKYVRAATDSIIAGESLRAICRDLAEQGVQTVPRRFKQPDGTKGEPESREWQPAELRKMLLRPRNAGLIEHDGEIVGKAVWPAIVPEETWRACRDVLQNPTRRTTTTNARVWLGSGIYLCHCGETVRGSTTGVGGVKKAGADGKTHRPAYRCRTGGHVVRDVYAMDEYIEGLAVDRLSRPDALELLLPAAPAEEPQENLAADANALRAKLDSIAEDYGQDLITRKQMLDMSAFTRARLEKVNAKMAGRASGSVLASLPLGTPEIAELWPGYHLDKRRSIIDALMTVTIHQARRGRPPGFKPGSGEGYFDDSTIRIDWKQPQAG